MKVFISADIEGISSTVSWEECTPGNPNYPRATEQMTQEVLAACEGAHEAGADTILVKDAHGPGTNIDILQMPEYVTLRRRWNEDPYCMVEGLDSSFDAALFVGYHSAAGQNGNLLSHTISQRPFSITINGITASEFLIYSYAAAYLGVPTVYLSGDLQLCQTSINLHPNLITTAVKNGDAFAAECMSPKKAVQLIRHDVKKALSQPLNQALIKLPDHFVVEITFKDHAHSARPSHYPGMKRKDSHTVVFEHNDYLEVLRMILFVL